MSEKLDIKFYAEIEILEVIKKPSSKNKAITNAQTGDIIRLSFSYENTRKVNTSRGGCYANDILVENKTQRITGVSSYNYLFRFLYDNFRFKQINDYYKEKDEWLNKILMKS